MLFNCILVIGTGRSGTHWLGYTLAEHPDIRATFEQQPMFNWVTSMAIDHRNEVVLLPKLVNEYKEQIRQSGEQIYLDKSHPNIWLAPKLKELLPDVLFLGIERSPYATVASMIKHQGVTVWQDNWKKFPLPCRFLGTSENNIDSYKAMSAVEKCATRWLAHNDQMKRLDMQFDSHILVINYENLIINTATEIKKLEKKIGLTTPIPIPEVKRSSLSKWQTQLSQKDIDEIHAITGINPDSVPV